MIKSGQPDRFHSTLDSNSVFAIINSLAYHQRLFRVAEGTGPLKPQQPGPWAEVLIPARRESSEPRSPGTPVVEDSTPKLLLTTAEAFAFASAVARSIRRATYRP